MCDPALEFSAILQHFLPQEMISDCLEACGEFLLSLSSASVTPVKLAFTAYSDIDSAYYTVLVLAEIFFIAAHMVLCFGFVTKTVLISVKAFSAAHTASPASRLGVAKRLGGDTAGEADPN